MKPGMIPCKCPTCCTNGCGAIFPIKSHSSVLWFLSWTLRFRNLPVVRWLLVGRWVHLLFPLEHCLGPGLPGTTQPSNLIAQRSSYLAPLSLSWESSTKGQSWWHGKDQRSICIANPVGTRARIHFQSRITHRGLESCPPANAPTSPLRPPYPQPVPALGNGEAKIQLSRKTQAPGVFKKTAEFWTKFFTVRCPGSEMGEWGRNAKMAPLPGEEITSTRIRKKTLQTDPRKMITDVLVGAVFSLSLICPDHHPLQGPMILDCRCQQCPG